MNAAPKELATGIVRRLHAAGFAAFFVGGCVRDALLGREPIDFDIATDALPEAVEKLFHHTIGVGKKFGVMVVVEQEQQFQVATFRAESDYHDGRRPEKVAFGDPEADALRRDFTVNGLFLNPVTGELRDWVGGEKDIRAKIIRTIGAPEERFAEDHLRLLRAVRFAAQLDFQIDPATFAAVKQLAPKLKLIATERVREELMKLFRPPHAARGLDLLRESGLLEFTLPELLPTITCEQTPDFHPEGSVYNHIRLMLSKLPPDAPATLPWSVLLHDVAKPATQSRDDVSGKIHFYGHETVGARMAEKILARLRFSNDEIEEIVTCVRFHMQFKDAPQMRKATLRRLLLRETFPVELQLHQLDCLGSHGKLDIYDFVAKEAEELAKLPAIRPPLLTGADLIALGMQPGPAMGVMLDELRDLQLAEEITSPEIARDWVKMRLSYKE